MDSYEIETLRRDIDDLKRAVRRSNPFLHSILGFRSYAVLSIVFGLVILLYCLGLHILALGAGSPARIPDEWKLAAWVGMAAIIAFGMVAKFIIVNRKAREVEDGATILSATKAVYDSFWVQVNAPVFLFMIIASIFVVSINHAWFVESILAIGFSFLCVNFGSRADHKELLAIGWYLLLSGLGSLFFIESAPFLWSAVVWSGSFLSYGVFGLMFIKGEKRS